MSKQMKADAILLLVTLCWGVSYLLMDISLTELDPFTLNAFRFLGAFLIAVIFSWKKLLGVNKTTLKYSFFLGCALVVVYIGATFGVKYTTLSNSGFLCALTVIFTPIISWLLFRNAPGKKLSIVVLMCFVGIALLTLGDDFSINTENLKGDLLCVMCALAYAIDLIFTEKAVNKEDKDITIKSYIKTVYHKNKRKYGYRRITLELKNQGILINHKRVKRLMKIMGLYGIMPKAKYKSYRGDMN